jgi:hypothetical protein
MPSEIVIPKKKWILRLFTRSVGLLENITYETPGELVDKFFPDKTKVAHVVVNDSVDEPVDMWFNDSGHGEVVMLTVTEFLGPQRVQAPPPGMRIPPGRMS